MGVSGQRDRLLAALRDQGVLRSDRVEAALRSVPRERFVPEGMQDEAYDDNPLPLPGGQTVSAPHMVAIMLDALEIRPGHRVLEVGGGSGYHAALLAHLASPGGRVDSIERIPSLAEWAAERLQGLELPCHVEVHAGDGSAGLPERAPFDRVSVAAAAPAVPAPLVDQLAPGGILVVPVGPPTMQTLLRVRKDENGQGVTEALGPCAFVPLLGRYGFAPGTLL